MVYIYALRQGKKVVYVGQSKDLKRRMREHSKEKEFDNHIILDSAENKKDALLKENYYIMKHDPKLNKILNGFGEYGTIRDLANFYKIKPKHLKNWIKYYGYEPSFSNKYITKEIFRAIEDATYYENHEERTKENLEHMKIWLGEELYEIYVTRGEIFDGKVH